MKKVLFIFLCILLLAACGPSPEELAQQTHSAATATAASWTKTPTPTHTPIITPTPEPTPTQTQPPTPHPVKWQETLSDGSTRIVDSEVGYELILPPNWVIIPIYDKEQYDESWASFIEMYPEMAEIKDLANEFVQEESRVLALYHDPANIDNEEGPYLVFTYIHVPGIEDIPLESIFSASKEMGEEMLDGFTFYEPECKVNFSGINYCQMTYEMNTFMGRDDLHIRGLLLNFKIEEGLAGISIYIHISIFPDFEEMFEDIINSIKLLDK